MYNERNSFRPKRCKRSYRGFIDASAPNVPRTARGGALRGHLTQACAQLYNDHDEDLIAGYLENVEALELQLCVHEMKACPQSLFEMKDAPADDGAPQTVHAEL
jgi:hypothetical protein